MKKLIKTALALLGISIIAYGVWSMIDINHSSPGALRLMSYSFKDIFAFASEGFIRAVRTLLPILGGMIMFLYAVDGEDVDRRQRKTNTNVSNR